MKKKKSILTKTEIKILAEVARGISSKEIAVHLDISPHTVNVHCAHIMRKLNIHKRAQLVIYAIKNRIIKI